MKTFNNLEELKPYYNKQTNTYDFIEDNELIDVEFAFELTINANINAWNIKANDIKANDINASNINAWDIAAFHIDASNINAWDIDARNINAFYIKANDISANDISANDIDANDISFYAICSARKTFVCNSISGRRTNSKYFCLDNEVIVKNANKEKRNV